MASDRARERALAKAAEIRAVRAQVTDALTAATTTLDQVFDRAAGEPMVADIKILTVLESVPDVGKVRARRILETAGVAESRHIAELNAEARRRLLEELLRGDQR